MALMGLNFRKPSFSERVGFLISVLSYSGRKGLGSITDKGFSALLVPYLNRVSNGAGEGTRKHDRQMVLDPYLSIEFQMERAKGLEPSTLSLGS